MTPTRIWAIKFLQAFIAVDIYLLISKIYWAVVKLTCLDVAWMLALEELLSINFTACRCIIVMLAASEDTFEHLSLFMRQLRQSKPSLSNSVFVGILSQKSVFWLVQELLSSYCLTEPNSGSDAASLQVSKLLLIFCWVYPILA